MQIINLGFSVPPNKFTQKEIIQCMNINSEKTLRFFEHKHIATRNLLFENIKNNFEEENFEQLRTKFLKNAVPLIGRSIQDALTKSQLTMQDLDCIAIVTSTGFLVPGLSALIVQEFKLKNSCTRLDIVGMGCNAGLNGLQFTTQWTKNNPGKIAALVCCELCSCIYSMGDNENSAIVNSLFGDGVATCLLGHDTKLISHNTVIDFESYLIPNSLDSLKFDWDKDKKKYSFYIDKKTPKMLAENIQIPLEKILTRNKIEKSQIKNWIVHSGGEAILDAIQRQLDLNENDFRHTRSILNQYGNISSGSFLFSMQELINEKTTIKDDYGMLVTMGPGLTIELALIKWL